MRTLAPRSWGSAARQLIGGLTIVAAAALAGCVSGDPTSPVTDFEVDCATDEQPPAGSARAVVRIRDFSFSPAELTVDAGTEVTWVNCEGAGGAAHTTTSDDDVWDSGLLDPDMGQYSRVFDDTGRFPYHCMPHPFMQAEVLVE